MATADELIRDCGSRAQAAAGGLAQAPDQLIDDALRGMADGLRSAGNDILGANADDVTAAEANGLSPALVDRLRLTDARLTDMAEQLTLLAGIPHMPRDTVLEDRPDGLRVIERRRPVGVIGATYEARPNVTVDIASQFLKSRNAGVLRTGSAAYHSAQVLLEQVIHPAMATAGLDPHALQLVPGQTRETATALVRQPDLIPLVVVRGSGETTRALGREASAHGVRVLAHADGGGVLYVHRDADPAMVRTLIDDSLDRLGVCNRLNLLLLDAAEYDRLLAPVLDQLEGLSLRPSLPPHDHPRGFEWALDDERSATVTIDAADGPVDAARIANEDTSGLAAGIATNDQGVAEAFIDSYAGTGVFWNSTTRLLDGFKLLRLPETGITIESVPGPRGPVTFRDLYLKQLVVVPS